MLPEFDLTIPKELDEALGILVNDRGAVPLAGGTNLLVDMRARQNVPKRLVGLGNVSGLRRIEVGNGRVTIGGRVTVSDILRHPRMAEYAPSLVASAKVFGGQMVRNAATIAGNICYGSPAADLVPPLLSLTAEVTLASRKVRRVVPLCDFFLGYKQDVRRPEELVTEISWNKAPSSSVNLFYKLARRWGDAIAIVGVAVSIGIRAGKCNLARIALGAVAPTVVRARRSEEMLLGHSLTPHLIEAAALQAVEESDPIDDIRASAEYRCHSVHVLTRRLVTQAWNQLL